MRKFSYVVIRDMVLDNDTYEMGSYWGDVVVWAGDGIYRTCRAGAWLPPLFYPFERGKRYTADIDHSIKIAASKSLQLFNIIPLFQLAHNYFNSIYAACRHNRDFIHFIAVEVNFFNAFLNMVWILHSNVEVSTSPSSCSVEAVP
jgi:hypothetical protein